MKVIHTQKKIIWLAHEANISGANICMLEYMRLLNKQYSQLLVLPHAGDLENQALKLSIPTVIIPQYQWIRTIQVSFLHKKFIKRFIRNFIAFWQLISLFVKVKPNFVFTNTITHGLGSVASKLLNIPHFWFIHEMGEEDFGFRLSLGRFSYFIMNKTTKKFFVNSEFVAAKFSRLLNSSKISIVYNPVLVNSTIETYKGEENNSHISLLMMGQITAAKGHRDAIDAVRILKNQGVRVKLDIFGKCNEPNYQKDLLLYIQKNDLASIVTFRGVSENPFETIVQYHVVLICSINEAMGRVALESMKLGIPVIGANTGGTLEIISDGVSGFLYQQGNPYSLATKITTFINTDKIESLTKVARERAFFLTENGLSKVIELIEKSKN